MGLGPGGWDEGAEEGVWSLPGPSVPCWSLHSVLGVKSCSLMLLLHH